MFLNIRILTDSSAIALSLPTVLPSMSLQSRWYSEPIRILWLKDSIFLKNAKGYPVLAKTQQALISRYMRLAPAPWLVLADDDFSDQSVSGNSPSNDPVLQPLTSSPDKPSSKSPTPAEASGMKTANKNTEKEDPVARLSYIRYLQRNQPSKSTIEKFGAGYQDYLQAPLQPLADNLESITYEVFETDPVKYDWYQKAMEYAFRDWAAEGRTVSSGDNSIILAVVGAGRGPLVARCLAAAEITKTAVEIWALEKNPNAAVMLEQRNATEWDRKVNLVKSDMRQWEGPRRKDGTLTSVDILVSELLGSLGDNELSPECLDGVHHLLNKHDGISIPQAYSAHMTPIAAPRLHAEVAGRAKIEEAAFETPYVVMLHSIDYLAISPTTKNTDVQYLWAFEHVKSENTNVCSEVNGLESAIGAFESSSKDDTNNRRNARYTKLHFSCPSRGVCHGLAGYFEAVLYAGPAGTVELSTNPLTMEDKSKDMISWFPMLFPLKVSFLRGNAQN